MNYTDKIYWPQEYGNNYWTFVVQSKKLVYIRSIRIENEIYSAFIMSDVTWMRSRPSSRLEGELCSSSTNDLSRKLRLPPPSTTCKYSMQIYNWPIYDACEIYIYFRLSSYIDVRVVLHQLSSNVLAAEVKVILWINAHARTRHLVVVLPEALGRVSVGGRGRGVRDASRRDDTCWLACQG